MRVHRGSLEGSGQATGKSDPEVHYSPSWRYLGTRRRALQQGRAGGVGRWGDRWCEGGMGRPSQRSAVLAFGLGLSLWTL